MIINVPIEPIPMRYSCDWDIWFRTAFEKEERPCVTIYGQPLTKGIEQGKFLDIIGTNYYKSTQLAQIIEMIQLEQIKSGDIIFFHDIWFPGIEQLFYIRDAMKLDIKIVGCLHAGAYDPNDMLYQASMGTWAVHFEHALFAGVDQIYLATYYHRNLIRKSRSLNERKLVVTGFPLFHDQPINPNRENIIVFPHRLDIEKHPEIFESVKNCFLHEREWQFVTTADKDSREFYWKTLNQAKVAVSFASQETWGIAMQEAVLCGCIPLVPNDLSYNEMYDEEFKYSTVIDAMQMLEKFMEIEDASVDFEVPLSGQQDKFMNDGSHAIANMLHFMRQL